MAALATSRSRTGNAIFSGVSPTLPLSFVPNAGQMDGDGAFESIGNQGRLVFGQAGVQLALPDGSLTVEGMGVNAATANSGTNWLAVWGMNGRA
ncbi:MAG: hypothetical protein KC434_21755 [Anaerolineales bacterium]|nr:hypothetical protein [Anaerolineales bacterium]